jgi:uncharacterized protein (UPF0261 family)
MVETEVNFPSSKPQRTTVSSPIDKDAEEECKPIIVASMFGNTTDCINTAAKVLEDAGYEVLIFHATGTGGKTMESLIESGMVAGVLDKSLFFTPLAPAEKPWSRSSKAAW